MTRKPRHAALRGAQLLLALAVMVCGAAVEARRFTDSAGRTVELPGEVETVYAAGPPAMVLVYVLKPEALTGWPRAPYPEELPYIAEPYRDLPETGRLTGRGGEAKLEVVLDIDPDRIDIDLRQATRQFYELFYHVDLSRDELNNLIRWTKGRAPQ